MINLLLTAGCSYSTCSNSVKEAIESPSIWPQFLFGMLPAKYMANLGMQGAGVQSTVYNLINFCETQYVDPSSTIVAFNISQLHRWDSMCNLDHPNACQHFGWSHALQHNWLVEKQASPHPLFNEINRHMEHEQKIKSNCLALIGLISYLKQKNLRYYFIMLDDNRCGNDTPEFFRNFVEKNVDQLITVCGFNSMLEFSIKTGMLSEDLCHPSTEGHRVIAEHMHQKIILDTI